MKQYTRDRLKVKMRKMRPSRVGFVRLLMSIPVVGDSVKEYMLDNYDPYHRLPVRERVGPYGERFYFEPLAATRDTTDWMFKVYTSQNAQDAFGVVTTIWLRRVELGANPSEDQIQRAFTHERVVYTAHMQERFRTHEWSDIAHARRFDVNASGRIALGDGEITIEEYERKQYAKTRQAS